MAFILIAGSTSLHAQSTGTIIGKVTDNHHPSSLEGVIVKIEGIALATSTNRFGQYALRNVPAGNQQIVFSYMGYAKEERSVNVSEAETITLNIGMGGRIIDLDTFVVSGRLVGTAKALNQQKSAESFRSVIASDAIGQLPDENAAEALNRIPGVSIERDQGEGRYVIIRGIDPELNNIQVNGVSLASPENETRSIALDVIPSELISSLEVTKVSTPDMNADSIGGSVNISMKSPFDTNGPILYTKANVLYNDLRGEPGFKTSITWGDLFMDEKLAFIIGTSYSEKKTASDNNEIDGPWVKAHDLDDNITANIFVPEEIEYREYNVTRYRKGISSALEYKPDENNYFYLKGLYNYFADQEARYRVEFKPSEKGEITSISTDNATFSGIVKTDRDLKDRFEEQTIMSLVAGAEQTFGNTRIDYSLSVSQAEENEPDRLDTDFRTSKKNPSDIFVDWSNPNQLKVTQVGGLDLWDPESFEFDEIANENNYFEESEYAATFNIRNDFELKGAYGYTKFGAKYSSKEKSADLEIDVNHETPDGLETLADLLDHDSGRNTFNQGPRGDVGAIREFFNSNKAAFAMEREEEDSESGDFVSNEDIISAYGMSSLSINKLTILAGLRVEQTCFETEGNQIELDEEGDIASIQKISADKDYTDFFPHLHLRYDISENIIGRVSVTKSIARPKFGQTAYRRQVNREDGEIKVGNPELDPFQSWNFDASLEFYSPNLGLFSASFFFKSIDNYIFDLESSLKDPETGYNLITYLNGESAEIMGLEFSFNRELTFLPTPFEGLGISANLTLSDSSANTDIRPSDNLRFIKQSDTIGTLAIYYQIGGFNMRIAGTCRSEYIDEFGESMEEDRWIDDHFQVDLTASYKVNDQFSIFAEVINLNDEPFWAYFNKSMGLSQYEAYSWSTSFGLKFSL